ncbi:hypothetical protein [Paenibacillus durus]|uniref:hypothetical protein n=1 Tax=Paenibacillus durus TaxID=44251 RepID=UPI0004AFBE0B|nr:hypothetical protein [Paenibacillus durus]
MTYTNPNKTVINRLNYFTKQLNKYSKARFDYLLRRSDKEPCSNRFERLRLYKDLMHKMIDQQNY